MSRTSQVWLMRILTILALAAVVAVMLFAYFGLGEMVVGGLG